MLHTIYVENYQHLNRQIVLLHYSDQHIKHTQKSKRAQIISELENRQNYLNLVSIVLTKKSL